MGDAVSKADKPFRVKLVRDDCLVNQAGEKPVSFGGWMNTILRSAVLGIANDTFRSEMNLPGFGKPGMEINEGDFFVMAELLEGRCR